MVTSTRSSTVVIAKFSTRHPRAAGHMARRTAVSHAQSLRARLDSEGHWGEEMAPRQSKPSQRGASDQRFVYGVTKASLTYTRRL